MEPHERNSTKFQLWRWAFLLLNVVLVAFGFLGWWKSRSERLQFIEPIWSDSLVGHQSGAMSGERRKIGEVWSLTRSGGFSLFGRGQSRAFEGRYPVFTASLTKHGMLSEKLLNEMREEAEFFIGYVRSNWWDSIKKGGDIASERVAVELLFFTDQAVSLQESHQSGDWESLGGRSFVNRNGEWCELDRDELFNGKDWVELVSRLCIADLQRQGIEWVQPTAPDYQRWTSFDYHNLSSFSLSATGIRFYPPNSTNEAVQVFIPFEELRDHLKLDGPHKLFQAKISD